MVKVIGQSRDHPLMPLLNKYIDFQTGVGSGTARGKPYKPRGDPKKVLNQLGTAIFQHCVEKWNALPQEAKDWYSENAPPQFCTGFLWYTWSCLIKNYNAGPWTVKASTVGGHCYIRPEGTLEGIWAKGYVDATEIGTLAHIDWEEGCPEENLPLLLVHGAYHDPIDPAKVWKALTIGLTSQDPTKVENYIALYDPDHKGDPNYLLRCISGEGRTVYISNYTHDPENGTPDDIRKYAASLAREIEIIKNHRGAPAVDIIGHNMGGIIARAYVENQDFPDNPFPAPFQHDVRSVIMLAPPNQGAYLTAIYAGWWDWTSVTQLTHGSEFLTQLNAGTTGEEQGVIYYIVASNKYECFKSKPLWLPIPVLVTEYTWYVDAALQEIVLVPYLAPFILPAILPLPVIIPHDAQRICEWTRDLPDSDGETNDQMVCIRDTKLPEVPYNNYYIWRLDHWEMIGTDVVPCEALHNIKWLLANYDLAKWRAKGKDIEPPQMNWVQRALYMLKKSKSAFNIYNYIVEHDIGIEVEDLPPSIMAYFSDSRNAIVIDPSAEAELTKVVAQYLVHEGEHARWYPENSIFQEYSAFKTEAAFWKEVKKGDSHDVCDWVRGFVTQRPQAAMEYLSSLPDFATLPAFINIAPDMEAACNILLDDPTGISLLTLSQRKAKTFGWGQMWQDVHVWYYPDEDRGVIDIEWQGLPPEVVAACLAYFGARVQWNIPDSKQQEVSCYMTMARVWKAVHNGISFEPLDEIAEVASNGESAMWYWICSLHAYDDLPAYYP